ncbi:pyridoxal phosphate-dependent aminotransferase [Ampullimonas aquatilis]|uniref:pyridoxal phosphate-dependent aminotransferase n=1 Tax=Ampullimonas aquatilis TaxID=1341549 RepID=UPI003C770FF9
MMTFPSRLPAVGTTIFTVMSALAAKHGAVNLGQGFPDFDCDPTLIHAVHEAMQQGHNQYAPMTGIAPLRKAIADKTAMLYGHHYDADTDITVTAGATQALLTVVLCCVHPGDEVIIIEPAYDSYRPAIALAGGVAIPVAMRVAVNPASGQLRYHLHIEDIARAITPRTRLIMLNTPHNPTGTTLQANDLQALSDLLVNTDILLCADEVYEHMVFDDARHESVARYPQLAERSFVVSSFGKTFHVTGWKIGYVAAPAALSLEFRKVHQFNVFAVNTPMQLGLAHYLRDPASYQRLSAFYQAKRDRFIAGLNTTRFQFTPSAGTYFQCVDYRAISTLPEAEFCEWLTTEIGVAAIPPSAFYGTPIESGMIRFCFAKKDSTLDAAIARLQRI